MGFTFYKEELLRALRLLEPYAGDEQTKQDAEPYFDDKVVFGFGLGECSLSVHHKDSQIHVNIPYYYDEPDLVFCMELRPLIKILEHISAQLLRFEEEPFFGFLVYSVWQEHKTFLFEIKAFSVRKLKGYKVSTSSCFDIEKRTFMSLLSELYQYTGDYDLRPYKKYIWFYGNGRECFAIATDGHKTAYKRMKTLIELDFCFGILGKEVPLLSYTLSKMGRSLQVHMDQEYNSIYSYDDITGTEIHFVHYLPKEAERFDLPKATLNLKSEIIHSATASLHEIKNTMKRIGLIDSNIDVFLHFFNGHVNIHSYDENLEEETCSEFLEVQNNVDDFVVRHKARTLLLLLDGIKTITVRFCVDARGLLHVLEEQETVFGDTDRFAAGCLMEETERKVVERKDFLLARNNKHYRKLYFR